MFVDTSQRSTEPEIMDDMAMTGDLLSRSLGTLDIINKWLGGNIVTMSALKELMSDVPKERKITIVDIGCGSGDMLRIVARWLRKRGQAFHIIGIDANAFTIDYAKKHSKEYPEIEYMCTMVPSDTFAKLEYDILLSTLFLHHLNDQEILSLLKCAIKRARLGIIINDLHRNRWAYFLFNLLTLFVPNPMIRQDGLTSILRGFKRPELHHFAQQLSKARSTIRWRWAFRYQWIIRTSR
jgi:2-polyprenyl-3-methyl-5-hydroxy-6-metoxy-1,4-benzoquinol methylase